MRTIIFVFIGLLVGCNSSSNDSGLQAQVIALNQQVQTLQAKLDKLQLIGRPTNTIAASTYGVRTLAMLSEPIVGAPSAATIVGQFGPCLDMGVQDGSTTNTGVQDALAATSKAFKTCTGYHTEYLTTDGSLKPADRIYWDGPNCTGNLIIWESGGASYDTESLKDGVVFASPLDGKTPLMVTKQTPQSIQIQSVFVSANPICQPDVETQLMYFVTPNNTQITGVPNAPVGQYTTGAP